MTPRQGQLNNPRQQTEITVKYSVLKGSILDGNIANSVIDFYWIVGFGDILYSQLALQLHRKALKEDGSVEKDSNHSKDKKQKLSFALVDLDEHMNETLIKGFVVKVFQV